MIKNGCHGNELPSRGACNMTRVGAIKACMKETAWKLVHMELYGAGEWVKRNMLRWFGYIDWLES